MLSLCLLIVTSIVGLASPVSASLYNATANPELERYVEEVKIVSERLVELGCQDPDLAGLMTELQLPTTDEVKLRMKKKLYERLIDMLVECEQQELKVKAFPTTTRPPTTTTIQTITTTTVSPQPIECQNAMNLTESWRQEHKGKNLKPKNHRRNCDTKDMVALGRPWF